MADQMALLYPKYPYRDELRITCWQLGKMHTLSEKPTTKITIFWYVLKNLYCMVKHSSYHKQQESGN